MTIFKPKFPPITTALALCISGHVSKAGSFRTGVKVERDHAAVKAAPICWVNDDLDAAALHAVAVLRFGMALPSAPPQGY